MNTYTSSNLEVSVPGEWAIKKVLGPTLDLVGSDLAQLYRAGVDRIAQAALRKKRNTQSGRTNLRVTRDVLWNGSYTEEAISAEYFGGILASSITEEGKDDRGVYYTDIIKSLSSQQLLLHYCIYKAFNSLWVDTPPTNQKPNPGMGDELQQTNLWFVTRELESHGGISTEKDVVALYNKGLIGQRYEVRDHVLASGKSLGYTKVQPSTLGVQLYAVAHNKLSDWRNITDVDFGSFENIPHIRFFAHTIESLVEKTGAELK